MGLSTKQVSSDGLDWSQNFQLPKPPAPGAARRQPLQNGLQPPPEQLKCPRCDSTNTKFCYYNNYNKTQPRHYCRACKRHWTKGGTLRNVPVGGGRKNKRLRKSSSNTCAASAAATAAENTLQLEIDHQDQKIMPFYQQNLDNNNNNNIIFSSSSLPFSFPFSSSISTATTTTTNSSSFDTNLSSISTSLQSSNVYNFSEDPFKSSVEEATITSVMPNVPHQPVWKSPAASAAVDVYSNDWNWEDIETLVSADVNLPWEMSSQERWS